MEADGRRLLRVGSQWIMGLNVNYFLLLQLIRVAVVFIFGIGTGKDV